MAELSMMYDHSFLQLPNKDIHKAMRICMAGEKIRYYATDKFFDPYHLQRKHHFKY